MVRRKLGQHFLINQDVVDHEIAYAELSPQDCVLEIGPGHGVLTRKLAQKAGSVIAVEVDPILVAELQENLPKNVILIHNDILKIDLSVLPPFTKIVANLPFQISSPFTFKILKHSFDRAVLMYQKDFAQRMVAHPGTREYSRLSVGVYYSSYCRILEDVSKNCFSPRPKVDCCIVELTPRKKPAFVVRNETFFFDLTKQLFSQRRKKIKNILRQLYFSSFAVPFVDQRVEDLSPEDIGELSNMIWAIQHKK